MFAIILTVIVICMIEWFGDRDAVRRAMEARRKADEALVTRQKRGFTS